MRIKPGVELLGITPQAVVILLVAMPIWERHGETLVWTSGTDGEHSNFSSHKRGMAVDLRTRYFDDETKTRVAEELQEALGGHKDFQVVIHPTHIHVQWRPR